METNAMIEYREKVIDIIEEILCLISKNHEYIKELEGYLEEEENPQFSEKLLTAYKEQTKYAFKLVKYNRELYVAEITLSNS